ncbi:4742_t:CDS:2, partial [Gigaspora rosea]
METSFEDSITDDLTSKIHSFETNNVNSKTTETHPYSFLANNESEDNLVNTIDVHDEKKSDKENE